MDAPPVCEVVAYLRFDSPSLPLDVVSSCVRVVLPLVLVDERVTEPSLLMVAVAFFEWWRSARCRSSRPS